MLRCKSIRKPENPLFLSRCFGYNGSMEGGADLAKERIGFMGGSFNPIHYRHLTIAACALTEAKLNRVIFCRPGIRRTNMRNLPTQSIALK